MLRQVSVQVPASSANLGPGFDSLGLALELYNVLSLAIADDLRIDIVGEGADRLPRNENNLVWSAIKTFYGSIGKAAPKLHLSLQNRIPLARGLGSSAAAVVGGLFGANALAGNPLSLSDLLRLAYDIEGHPDNVAAAIFGGLTIAVTDGENAFCVKCPVPEGLKAVLFIPDQAMSTRSARRILPRFFSRVDAVYNISRASALVAALATNQLQYLEECTRDRWHQPYREKIFPAMPRLFAAAKQAGALGAFLSGAGSTVCALCTANEKAVAEAMEAQAERLDVPGRAQVVGIATAGVRLAEPVVSPLPSR